MSTDDFFDLATEQSIIKAAIVEKYFTTWAAIITRTQKQYRPEEGIRYIDLFAGPGIYKDGTQSTPIRVLERAIASDTYARKLRSIFNDVKPEYIEQLKLNIQKINGIKSLSYDPIIWNRQVDIDMIRELRDLPKMPGLAFIDPWGYKGLSLELISTLIQGWGCDCIFFFNFRRINAALQNNVFQEHMEDTFGAERSSRLDQSLRGLCPEEREMTVLNELSVALMEQNCPFVLPFTFRSADGMRTSHHLVLATKDFKGYEVMKEIMAKYSSEIQHGVPSFIYSPVHNPHQQILYELFRPLEDLRGLLLERFSNRTLSVKDLYVQHSVGHRYILKNYKEVLRQLWLDKVITANREPRTGFKEDIIVTFPKWKAPSNG